MLNNKNKAFSILYIIFGLIVFLPNTSVAAKIGAEQVTEPVSVTCAVQDQKTGAIRSEAMQVTDAALRDACDSGGVVFIRLTDTEIEKVPGAEPVQWEEWTGEEDD